MSDYFGTDGIRGVVNKFLTLDLVFNCGCALAKKANEDFKNNTCKDYIDNQALLKFKTKKPLIVIGGDTRTSRQLITLAFSCGAISAGVNVVDVGICPTAGIAYITKQIQADFGVVISASHNPPQYNGIKIFNSNGVKLSQKEETRLEKDFFKLKPLFWAKTGEYKQKPSLTSIYTKYLTSICKRDLMGLNVVLDCANGASYNIATKVFKSLGARVTKCCCKDDGKNINNKCGAVYPKCLSNMVKKHNADMGFAFDGDADRLIACDEQGNILDGDILVFTLAKYFKNLNMISKNTVVGTTQTNSGLECDLNRQGIKLVRTEVGDKYIIEKLNQSKLNLGGEKSGHIILKDFADSADGILAAVKLAEIVAAKNKSLSQISKVKLYPQININCTVKYKQKIINDKQLKKAILSQQKLLGNKGRIIVRCSGTEPKIRIMVEGQDKKLIKIIAINIKNIVKKLNN